MKKRLGKLMAILLAFTLFITMAAGCKKNEGTTQGTKAAALDKTVKLRVAYPQHLEAGGYESGATADNNQFLNAVKEKTGYKNIDWYLYPTANAKDNFNLMFASGDVYDVVYNSDIAMYNNYVTQGNLLALDSLIKQYGPNISKTVNDKAWEMVTNGGKRYAVAMPSYQNYNNVDMSGGFLVRKDWMDKLGLKAPKTTDELETFLKAIKDGNPNGKGTIPFVSAASGVSPLSGLDVITAAFGLNAGNYIVKDGKLVDARDLYLKDCLTYIARLYKEGLIDNEYIFNKSAQVTEKITSSKAASVFCAYYDDYNYQTALTKLDANAKLVYLPPVSGPKGFKGYSMVSPVTNLLWIPKNAKYAAQAVDLLNTYLGDKDLQQFICFGKEGRDYTKNSDGSLTPIQPAYKNIMYKICYRLWTSPEIWTQNAILAGYKPQMTDYASIGQQATAFNIGYYMPQSETQVSKGKTQDDLFNQYVAKIINGALPVSAVDDYLKEADTNGRQTILKENQQWFTKEGKAIYDKLNKKS